MASVNNDRPNILIRNIPCIMTMDPLLGNISGGDIYIENGQIKSVGKTSNTQNYPTSATIIDGSKMIVLPGLVDTHWHMWTALLRSLASRHGIGYFKVKALYGTYFTAEDMYHGTMLACTEAISSGITTVHNWCHNIQNVEYALSSIKALKELNVRGRFSYGVSAPNPQQPLDLKAITKLHTNWSRDYSNDGLLALGIAWRGLHPDFDLGKKELEFGRKLGIPISYHANDPGDITQLASENMLGVDLQIIHAVPATDAEVKQLGKSNSPVCIAPFTELRLGYGIAPIPQMLDAKLTMGLSIDSTALTGNTDMFAVMKVFYNLTNALNKKEFSITAQRVLEIATIEGARSLGMSDTIGSLTVGKRADLIMIDLDDINLGFLTEPANLIVEAAQRANVDTVIVDGRILKSQGKLTSINKEQVIQGARRASQNVIQRVQHHLQQQ